MEYYSTNAFKLACQNGNLSEAQWLLRQHPDINIRSSNDLAFYFACKLGHSDVVHWLLSVEPNIISLGSRFWGASENGHLDFVFGRLLLNQKIDISLTSPNMQEKIYAAFLKYCFAHKNINLLIL